MKRLVLIAFTVLLASVALVFALAASGDDGHGKKGRHDEGNGQKTLRATLAPSMPSDPTFHGVGPGGVPWQLERGSVRIKRDGEFDLEVRGLVIPSLGNPGPVTTISSSLFCGADSNTTPAATTQQVPLSHEGDAKIEAKLSLPSTCLAPIVLVHPNGGTARYIAVTGWRT